MSTTKKRKNHTAEFKARVGLEAIRSQKTITKQPPAGSGWVREIGD